MKKENTSMRLKKLMNDRNIKQIDILNACIPFCKKYDVKMNKSDISQYVSGKVEPNQNKLFVLGNALNVNEAWLMGYEVPMERITTQAIVQNADIDAEMTMDEDFKQLYLFWKQLNETGKRKLIDNASDLAKLYSE